MTSTRSVLSALLLGPATLLLTASHAHAAPPPPTFWSLKVENTTPSDIDDVTIRAWPCKVSDHTAIHGTPFVFPLQRIKAGTFVLIRLEELPGGAQTAGATSIVKMEATFNVLDCPSPLALTAPKLSGQDYASYTEDLGGTSPPQPNMTPLLTFAPGRVTLKARARFGSMAGPMQMVTAP